jgi:hypothetical protein
MENNMNFRILIWLFFCFLINICSACQCVNPPFYFTQNLQYDYICHVKIIKHYPSGNARSGDFEGLTKVVILNSRYLDQIQDTLLFINSCPSLVCGQRLDHYPVGKEILIKAYRRVINDYSEVLCDQEIVTQDTYKNVCLNEIQSFDFNYKYKSITSHSCDNVILEVENENVKGLISSKYQSSKFKFYKFISFFSKKWAESFAIKTKTNKYEQQSVKTFEIFKKLKFISNKK